MIAATLVQAVVDLAAQQAAAKVQKGRPGSASQKVAAQAEAAVPARQPALRLGLAWQVSSISESVPCIAILPSSAISEDVCAGMP